MAEQVSIIQYKGKLGQTVGFRGQNGKNLLRERLTSIANPQTEDQMAQRARFKLTSQVSGMLGTVAQTALRANGLKASARGELNKMIMPFVTLNDNNVAELNYKLDLIKNGAPVSHTVTANLVKSAQEKIFFVTGLPAGTMIAKTVMTYNVTTGKWNTLTNLSTSNAMTYAVPAGENLADIAVYAYAVAIVPTTTEGAARLESIKEILPASSKGYMLAINRLDNQNFNFTRVMSLMVPSGSASGMASDTITPQTNLPQVTVGFAVVNQSTMETIENFQGSVKINGEVKSFVEGKINIDLPKYSTLTVADFVFDNTQYELLSISADGDPDVTLPSTTYAENNATWQFFMNPLS